MRQTDDSYLMWCSLLHPFLDEEVDSDLSRDEDGDEGFISCIGTIL